MSWEALQEQGGLLDATRAPGPVIEDPIERARFALTAEDHLGRTAREWVGSSTAESLLALTPSEPAAPADLADEVLRVYDLVGVPVSADIASAIQADAAEVPAELRAPFAAFVRATADAYQAQVPIAHDVLSRWPAEFSEVAFVSPEQREAMRGNAHAVLAAQNAFRAAVADVDLASLAVPSGPLFKDPAGLVVLGGLGDDTYDKTPFPAVLGFDFDPVVLVDLTGSDTYRTTAGGACPDPLHLAHTCNGLALSVNVDLSGDDLYTYDGAPAAVQGAGSIGGVGILVDTAGDDRYESTMTRTDSGPLFQYIDGGAQGFAQAGYGVLLDATGHDTYQADVESALGRSIWDFAQGFGSAGGVGLLADGVGADRYLAHGIDIPHRFGFIGVYNGGSGFYAGVGLQVDTGLGDDLYRSYDNGTTTDYYALGFGAFAGLGILFDDGGDDEYIAVEVATDPWIATLLNCAFGTGSLGGVGIFLDFGGHDSYFGDTITPYRASTMNEGFGGIGAAYGLHVDLWGDDDHLMYASGGLGSMTSGRGSVLSGGNIAGNYLDLGGIDTYAGADKGTLGGSRDDAVWLGGADINAVPDPLALLGWS